MALLLLPSKHWLIALVPLSVAFVALVWRGKDSDQLEDQSKQNKPAPAIVESAKPRSDELMGFENLNTDQPSDETSYGLDSNTKQIDWQALPGKLLATIKKLDSELTQRQLEVRQLQDHLEKTLKSNHSPQNTRSITEAVQQDQENIDFNQTQLINHANSILDSQETDLKRSMEKATKSIQQVEEQVRSYQEMLDLKKKMTF